MPVPYIFIKSQYYAINIAKMDNFDNLCFLYNKPIVFNCTLKNSIKSLESFLKENGKSINQDANLIVGVKVNIFSEVLHNYKIFNKFLSSKKKKIIEYLERLDFEVKDITAVYPNINMPRFCFSLTDNNSHRILINEILLPRKYSLTFINRVLLHLFSNIINIYHRPDLLVGNILIIAKKIA